MSEVENTKPVVNSSRFVVRLFLGAVFFAGLWLILPLYMQNRMNALYELSYKLSAQIDQLEKDLLQQEFNINKYSSLEYLLSVSSEWGLGLNDVPTKIRIVGGEK